MSNKVKNFIDNDLKKIIKPRILEFGVEYGNSTKYFLENIKSGNLISVDTSDCSHLFKNKQWTFINCRDDNYEIIDKYLKKKIDIIFIDTTHTADHVEKIFYLYFKKLKINGFMLIDDISWIPYCKGQYRDHPWVEKNNKETFFRMLEIYNSNKDKLDISFNFLESGLCKVVKIKDKKLKRRSKIYTRKFFIRSSLDIIKNFFSF
jgi:predicted O-methyltransferase YrrM